MNIFIAILVIVGLLTTSWTIFKTVKQIQANRQHLLQRKTILAEGLLAQALINSVRQTNVTVDEQPQVELDLTVTMQDGEVVHTKLITVIPIIHIPDFQKGKVIEVKYMTIDNDRQFEATGAYLPNR